MFCRKPGFASFCPTAFTSYRCGILADVCKHTAQSFSCVCIHTAVSTVGLAIGNIDNLQVLCAGLCHPTEDRGVEAGCRSGFLCIAAIVDMSFHAQSENSWLAAGTGVPAVNLH